MATKYVVACDGSPASERAFKFAVLQAGETGATITLAQVLDWSPYAFLAPEEIEERHKRHNEEIERAKQALMTPLTESLADSGLTVDSVIRYGHVAETLVAIAEQEGATRLYIGWTGPSNLATRFFGSVASTMAQIAPVPCTIVP